MRDTGAETPRIDQLETEAHELTDPGAVAIADEVQLNVGTTGRHSVRRERGNLCPIGCRHDRRTVFGVVARIPCERHRRHGVRDLRDLRVREGWTVVGP